MVFLFLSIAQSIFFFCFPLLYSASSLSSPLPPIFFLSIIPQSESSPVVTHQRHRPSAPCSSYLHRQPGWQVSCQGQVPPEERVAWKQMAPYLAKTVWKNAISFKRNYVIHNGMYGQMVVKYEALFG